MKNILKQFTDELKNEEKILSDLEETQRSCKDNLSFEIIEMHKERMMQKINASNSVIDRLRFFIYKNKK